MAPSGGVQVPLEICVFAGDGQSSGSQFALHGLQRAHVHRLESKHGEMFDFNFPSNHMILNFK